VPVPQESDKNFVTADLRPHDRRDRHLSTDRLDRMCDGSLGSTLT